LFVAVHRNCKHMLKTNIMDTPDNLVDSLLMFWPPIDHLLWTIEVKCDYI
jgi:hypothetical protein